MQYKYNKAQIESFIENNQIEPYYQAIRDKNNNTSSYSKFEILARIELEDGSVETPYFFIKAFKNYGLYHAITRQIVEKSFYAIKEIKEKHLEKEFKFSVNIQIDDITNADTVDFIKEKLIETDLTKNIIFELSEEDSLTGDNIKKTIEFIETFKKLGSEFALDDFGTGYSSFHPLLAFDFEYIKFDEVLIKNIHKEPKNYYICNMLVDLSKRVGLTTVAEYVEDINHQKALEAIDVDYYQGYLYSKPIKCIDSII